MTKVDLPDRILIMASSWPGRNEVWPNRLKTSYTSGGVAENIICSIEKMFCTVANLNVHYKIRVLLYFDTNYSTKKN